MNVDEAPHWKDTSEACYACGATWQHERRNPLGLPRPGSAVEMTHTEDCEFLLQNPAPMYSQESRIEWASGEYVTAKMMGAST